MDISALARNEGWNASLARQTSGLDCRVAGLRALLATLLIVLAAGGCRKKCTPPPEQGAVPVRAPAANGEEAASGDRSTLPVTQLSGDTDQNDDGSLSRNEGALTKQPYLFVDRHLTPDKTLITLRGESFAAGGVVLDSLTTLVRPELVAGARAGIEIHITIPSEQSRPDAPPARMGASFGRSIQDEDGKPLGLYLQIPAEGVPESPSVLVWLREGAGASYKRAIYVPAAGAMVEAIHMLGLTYVVQVGSPGGGVEVRLARPDEPRAAALAGADVIIVRQQVPGRFGMTVMHSVPIDTGVAVTLPLKLGCIDEQGETSLIEIPQTSLGKE